jgi:uncharacterized protein
MILDTHIPFLNKLFKQLKEKGVDVSNFELDHLGYRTESEEVFERLLPEMKTIGKQVHKNFISGNIVCVFKLHEPLKYHNYLIPVIEFIGPNDSRDYPTGFEHAEFVIDEDFEVFANRYPKLAWDKSAIDRPEFPALKLPLDENTQVKFHHETVLDLAKFYNEK